MATCYKANIRKEKKIRRQQSIYGFVMGDVWDIQMHAVHVLPSSGSCFVAASSNAALTLLHLAWLKSIQKLNAGHDD